ncbi:hypothetical protein BV898_07966 [Hypsibius exemplaris]|uniref:Protein kinase domain-containing protein n=1 Tax=Hypsibius exemplaris TaxID=2072580 RepID=A0A1W0WS53_HYPEX|nr:hypothetical protein BV898_07966 [Hypsibius exemplaris]
MGQGSSQEQRRRLVLPGLERRDSRFGSTPDTASSSHEFRWPYVLQATLGKGKNGVVYVAELTNSGDGVVGLGSRNIVVKKVPLSHKRKHSKQQVHALRDEIDALVSLEQGNLVKYFGWNIETPNEDAAAAGGPGEQQQIAYFRIFMEFCSGGTLQQRARKGLRYSQLRDCTRQILEGLAYLHAAGIVHGDLTTSSIFLTDRAKLHLKIGGFGKLHLLNALHAKKSPAQRNSFEAHNAPETQRASSHVKDIDPKSDIWNVAFILIELLHEGEREEFASTDELLQLIGGSLDSIIMWFLGAESLLGNAHLAYFAQNRKVIECISFLKACLQRNPADRPSAVELLRSAHISENLDEKEVRPETDVLDRFTVTNNMTEWLYQAVDNTTGKKVLLTKRVVELANWMDEFVTIATVVAFHSQLMVLDTHPQMITRTDCWACREPPSAAFVEEMTVYSCWNYSEPCILLEKVIANGDRGFSPHRVQNYARQVVAMLQPIWRGIQTCPLAANVVVLDLCSAYLLFNENHTKILMLPFLFPDVITDNDIRAWFIASNIWDLGMLVLSMSTGTLLLENREAGSFAPDIPDGLEEKSADFIARCFTCFKAHKAAGSGTGTGWLREPGVLTWSVEALAAHPFLSGSN